MMRLRRLRCFLGKKRRFSLGNCFQGQLKDIHDRDHCFNIISEAVNVEQERKKTQHSERIINSES